MLAFLAVPTSARAGVRHATVVAGGPAGARPQVRARSCPAGEIAQSQRLRTTRAVLRRLDGHLVRRRVLAWAWHVTCASAVGPRIGRAGSVYWPTGRPGAYGNVGPGSVADCTVATAADLEQIFAHRSRPADSAPWLAAYAHLLAEQEPGVQPGPDAGLAVGTVLAAWQGPGIAGTRIAAALPLGLGRASIEAALRRDPLYAVLDLPAPVAPGTPALVDTAYVALAQWTTAHPGSGYSAAGPHAAAVVGFDSTDVYLESWGYVQPVTWSWWRTYATTAWAITP